jgi:glycosyltransferase involved in cell wall biosynthesis
MLEAADRLRDVPNLHFMFVGDGAKWRLVEEAVRNQQSSNVSLLPWQPEETLPYSLATGELSLVSLEPGMEGLAVPSKAIYAMAAGSALLFLGKGDNEIKSWIESYDCGVVVNPGEVGKMVQRASELLADRESLGCLRRQARRAAEAHFSRSANTQRASAILSGMLTGNRSVSLIVGEKDA